MARWPGGQSQRCLPASCCGSSASVGGEHAPCCVAVEAIAQRSLLRFQKARFPPLVCLFVCNPQAGIQPPAAIHWLQALFPSPIGCFLDQLQAHSKVEATVRRVLVTLLCPPHSLLQPSRSGTDGGWGAGGAFGMVGAPASMQHRHPTSVACLYFYSVAVLLNCNILFPFSSFILHRTSYYVLITDF